MVRSGFRLLPLALITLFSISNFRATGWPAYRVGSPARRDVVTPIPLTVIDLANTARLRWKAAAKVPVCFEFRRNAATKVEAAFRADFILTRSNFLETVRAGFGRRKLNPRDLDAPRFHQVVLRFLLYNQHFPASTNLARAWAEGQSGRTVEDAIAAKLREVMMQPIQDPAALPPDIRIGKTVRLIFATKTNSQLRSETTGLQGAVVSSGKLRSLAAARSEQRHALPSPPDGVLADYLVNFLRPNCTVAAALTRRLRAERTGSILATIHYTAGQANVRQGQRIDPAAKAALDQLEHKTALAQMRRMQAAPSGVPHGGQRDLWLLAVGVLCLTAGVLLTWRRLAGALQNGWRNRSRRAERRTPSVSSPADVQIVSSDSSSKGAEAHWRRRALNAEHQARQARNLVRAGLLPWLAGLLSNGFVQRLILQRTRLLNSHRKAATELDRLGERLATVHTRMQDRLMAYEQRIGELEKALETKGEENRELIKAELDRLRQQRDAERREAA